MIDDSLPSLTIGYLIFDDSLSWKYFVGHSLTRNRQVRNFNFIFYDRCEIHIQACGYIFYGKIIISDPHLRKRKYENDVLVKSKTKHDIRMSFKQFKTFRFFGSHIYKDNIFQDAPIYSCIFEAFLVIVRRFIGPEFDNIFEVPKII